MRRGIGEWHCNDLAARSALPSKDVAGQVFVATEILKP